MFFELIGTILAGAAAGLMVWALNRTLRGRLPSWLVPASAGAAMLLAGISGEYTWFARSQATLPATMIVAQKIEDRAIYRPWTYAVPFVSRFVAVDPASARAHPDRPDQRIVDLVFFGRWSRTAKVPMLFDCAENRRADVLDGVEFAADGSVLAPDWRLLDPADPVLRAACDQG